MTFYPVYILFFVFLVFAPLSPVAAQTGQAADAAKTQEQQIMSPAAGVARLQISPPREVFFGRSLLFSKAELALIDRAMRGTPGGEKMLEATLAPDIIPPIRRIRVSGVVFRAEKDWVVWINGQKVTPDKRLPEIVDIQVEDQKVHLKWFDIGINDVISITLRPHQTYDIVTGVLLPG